MKRSDNEQDVQTVLEQFKAVDDMLERVSDTNTTFFSPRAVLTRLYS